MKGSEVARVLACLFEKDVEFQLIRVDSFRGPNRMPQYLKLQPHGEALTFEDGNVTLVGKPPLTFVGFFDHGVLRYSSRLKCG